MKKKLYYTLLFFIAIVFYPGKGKAQVSAIPFTPSLATYTPISGNVLSGPPNMDDYSFNNLPIGFDFYFAGVLHNTMSVTSNGYLVLDTVASGVFFNILSGQENNVLAPFGADLRAVAANAGLEYLTTGTAPNRVCTIQWSNFAYFGGQGNLNFQIQLYETSNCIKYVYGNNQFGNPMGTQIGIRGSNIQDFIALGDSSCNWAFAYPYASINTIFPVSSLCSMPSGFAFCFGPCAEGGSTNFGYLTGKVFNDLNGNSTLDAGEPGLPNRILNLMPGNYYVSSNGTGDFVFFFSDSSQTYNISTDSILYWNQTTSAISCQPATQPASGLNIGFQAIPGIHEVSVTCPSFTVRPGIPEPVGISYQNNGTSVENDTITFVMDTLYSFISATPAPDVVNGQSLRWAYSNLAPGQMAGIQLMLMPDSSAVMGNYLNSSIFIAPLNDTVPANNMVQLHQLITNSFDPNEKLAEPSGMIDPGTVIYYTIRFQNTGTAVAYNVIIRDTLDNNLDKNSFQLTGSSHPMNFSMDGSGVANFIFYNIMLPDSGTDLYGSNGFVSFNIKTKSDLQPFAVINNRAGIIFDTNLPVITNTTADTIQMPLGVVEGEAGQQNIYVTPNPVSENILLHFSDQVQDRANLNIYSTDGKLVLSQNGITSGDRINISHLPAGLYFCSLQADKGRRVVKILKE